MADEENVSRPAAMDLNLYLGLPRSSRPLSLDLGSDLSLCSLLLPSSSNSGESRAPEATSGAMEASASHAPYSPPRSFIGEADVPSVSPWPLDLENPMRPYFHAYEPYLPSCAQEAEGLSASYSPSNAQGLQIGQTSVDPAERDGQLHSPFDEILGLHLVSDDSEHVEDFQTQCSRTHPPPPSADFQDEHLHQSPDFRIRRLIESHGWRRSIFEQSLYGVDRTNFAPNSSPSSEQFTPETRSSQPNGKQKAPAESIDAESSENGADEKNKCSTNFDCNVCLDISMEPVVTSCGHLFCWPCLYQWLHLHSLHKECPVCKGEVIEANITPIYGRGSSGSEMVIKDEERKALGLSIPPRPRGLRTESWRQQFYRNSRRIGEGIANPRRRSPSYHLSSRGRLVELDDAFMQEFLSREPPSLLTRSMIRRFERAHDITESGPSDEESRFARLGELLPRDSGAAPVPVEIDAANEIRSLIAMNFGRRAGGSFSENADRRGLSPSVNAPTPDQFYSIPVGRRVTDQASASSTAAMICGESSVRDASTDPHSAGSSRPPRSIRESSAASSSDDGGNFHSRKRRRLH